MKHTYVKGSDETGLGHEVGMTSSKKAEQVHSRHWANLDSVYYTNYERSTWSWFKVYTV